MADAAASLTTAQTVKLALQVVHTLNLTAWQYPAHCSPNNGSSFDFIIVDGGSAGSVLANRLSANSSYSVLLVEAGGYPPLESENKRDKTCALTQGKMLGGSSSIYHMMYTRGDPQDYEEWVDRTNDTAWNVINTLPYFKKLEQLTDKELLESKFAEVHGTDGMIKIKRNQNQEKCSLTSNIIEAFQEVGHPNVMDSTSLESALGYTNVLYAIDDGVRQNSALAYLSPIKKRSNLCVSLFTTVTKILIKNKVAIGVQVTNFKNETQVLYANKEVIVSAGVLNSPKLLMLSGVGPRDHLEALDIHVVADLPVGQNYMDQPCAPIIVQLEESSVVSEASNPHEFPVPAFSGNVALNSSTKKPEYQTINLVFQPNSTDLLDLCSSMFSYTDEICQKFYEASINRVTLFSLLGLTLPFSRGQVLLASADPTAAPVVHTGIYSNPADLELMGRAFLDHIRVLNSSYFKSVNATILNLGLCNGTIDDVKFWECYSVAMSSSMWHFGGTCAMGLVLDSDMRVKDVSALRVVDSSSMPALISGKIMAPVGMLAERAADLIRTAHNII